MELKTHQDGVLYAKSALQQGLTDKRAESFLTAFTDFCNELVEFKNAFSDVICRSIPILGGYGNVVGIPGTLNHGLSYCLLIVMNYTDQTPDFGPVTQEFFQHEQLDWPHRFVSDKTFDLEGNRSRMLNWCSLKITHISLQQKEQVRCLLKCLMGRASQWIAIFCFKD